MPATCRLDQLTHGLYLGFSGLRSLDNQQLYALWHDENINTTMFLDATDAGKASAELTSLFAGGSMYIAAAKEVQFAVLHPSEATPLSQSRAWHFLQASGPGTLYGPFMESLDLMVRALATNMAPSTPGLLARLLVAVLCACRMPSSATTDCCQQSRGVRAEHRYFDLKLQSSVMQTKPLFH